MLRSNYITYLLGILQLTQGGGYLETNQFSIQNFSNSEQIKIKYVTIIWLKFYKYNYCINGCMIDLTLLLGDGVTDKRRPENQKLN